MHKDLSLFLDNAAAQKVPTPTAASLRETYNVARATGHGGEDIAAVIKAFESMAGTKVS
jgi:3-hydroxyisobutyrate dehydrogenase-like beta-hydroxyacid dehydrogenase